jgi:hypothetical protein
MRCHNASGEFHIPLPIVQVERSPCSVRKGAGIPMQIWDKVIDTWRLETGVQRLTPSMSERSDELVFHGEARGRAARGDPQFAVDRSQVRINGPGADDEPARHLGVGQALCH